MDQQVWLVVLLVVFIGFFFGLDAKVMKDEKRKEKGLPPAKKPRWLAVWDRGLLVFAGLSFFAPGAHALLNGRRLRGRVLDDVLINGALNVVAWAAGLFILGRLVHWVSMAGKESD